MVSVTELFRRFSLEVCGPVPWGFPIAETSSGVYAIALIDPNGVFAERMSETQLPRWNAGEEIIYIGKAKSLRRRISQFYRHKYGRSSPHRGGQDSLLLTAAIQVYWASAPDCAAAEHDMIDAFYKQVGALPFANRMRGAQRRSHLS